MVLHAYLEVIFCAKRRLIGIFMILMNICLYFLGGRDANSLIICSFSGVHGAIETHEGNYDNRGKVDSIHSIPD